MLLKVVRGGIGLLGDSTTEEFKMTNQNLYSILSPILFVKDLVAEKEFYLKLGFEVSYGGERLPSGEVYEDFIGLKYGDCIEFGIEKKENFDFKDVSRVLTWQISTSSLKEVLKLCGKYGIKVTQEPKVVVKDWNLWEVEVQSPNGYEVTFEGPKDF